MPAKFTTDISPEALAVLNAGTYNAEKKLFTLPPGQLERPLYEAVAKVLSNCGGVWSKKQAGFLFAEDPTEKLGLATSTGTITNTKKALQQFFTPPELATQLVELADIQPGDFVLEPSCGNGAILKAILDSGRDFGGLTAVEIDETAAGEARKLLEAAWDEDFALYQDDFLKMRFKKGDFQRIIMNPPFSGNRDIEHVEQALKWLAPGGRLVAVMWPNVERRKFRDLVGRYPRHQVFNNAPGAFSDSGTEVETITLIINA